MYEDLKAKMETTKSIKVNDITLKDENENPLIGYKISVNGEEQTTKSDGAVFVNNLTNGSIEFIFDGFISEDKTIKYDILSIRKKSDNMLNLLNSVAIVAYEVFRQTNFDGFWIW